mmetsp:Transcript_4113/g.5977  ORF Transcript_4113/g.5977 Transcript_4113/m.5977 type:complete len:201 (-) Transcript_4113:898-1500(-)
MSNTPAGVPVFWALKEPGRPTGAALGAPPAEDKAELPIATSTKASISTPSTTFIIGGADESTMGCMPTEGTIGEAPEIPVELELLLEFVATFALSCLPLPISIPFNPITATSFTFASAYSTKQYPLLVVAVASALTRWNALTSPNALNNSKTSFSVKWYGRPPMNILFGESGTVVLMIPSFDASNLLITSGSLGGAMEGL